MQEMSDEAFGGNVSGVAMELFGNQPNTPPEDEEEQNDDLKEQDDA